MKGPAMTSFIRCELLRSGIALSATSFVIGPATAHAVTLFAAFTSTDAVVVPREQSLLDFDWKFFQGSGCDSSHNLGFGYGQGDFAKVSNLGFAK